MPTKVFISWGGDQSRELAQALYEWLPAALQFVEPYFSPLDIEKGAKWNIDVSRELDSTNIGVLCLTPDNLTRPWILFEAGALSKSRAVSRVCPLLFNLEPTELTGPLTTLQAARINNEEFKQLISTINAAAGDAGLKPAVLDAVVEKWWPDLDARFEVFWRSREQSPQGTPVQSGKCWRKCCS